MSITSGVGLVSQEDKFGRVIAGDSYKNYLLLKPNDFAYNKSATKEYPEGFLTLYSGTKLAAVPSSIFTCFRIKRESPDAQFLNSSSQTTFTSAGCANSFKWAPGLMVR